MSAYRNLRYAAQRNGPGTAGLLAGMIAVFLIMVAGIDPTPWLPFNTQKASTTPWTAATYPFAISQQTLIASIFIGMWLWSIGGALERSFGTRRFVGFFFAMAVLGAVSVFVGSLLTGLNAVLVGAFIPVAATTVAWGTRNPRAQVTFMFLLPLNGKVIAWVSAVLVFIGIHPVLGLFALVPLAAAWAYAGGRLPSRFGQRRPTERNWRGTPVDDRYRDEVRRREKEREERERLRRIFEDDPPSGQGRR